MNIYDAIAIIEKYLEGYGDAVKGAYKWAPTETKIVPSGDDQDHIKIWFNLGEAIDQDQVEAQRTQFEKDLLTAHPELKDYTLEVRAESI